MLDELDDDALSVRTAAFHALRIGRAVAMDELAAAANLGIEEAEGALDLLVARGLAQRDAAGSVVASHGISVRPTRHGLLLDGVALHTWCAIDALGIPAALGVDAVATTTCAHCGRTIELRMDGGRAEVGLPYVLWCPDKQCSVIVEEFCPEANLFCDENHLEAWRQAAGEPPGRRLTVSEAQSLGRQVWADAAPQASR